MTTDLSLTALACLRVVLMIARMGGPWPCWSGGQPEVLTVSVLVIGRRFRDTVRWTSESEGEDADNTYR